jgi:hypothetical protein
MSLSRPHLPASHFSSNPSLVMVELSKLNPKPFLPREKLNDYCSLMFIFAYYWTWCKPTAPCLPYHVYSPSRPPMHQVKLVVKATLAKEHLVQYMAIVVLIPALKVCRIFRIISRLRSAQQTFRNIDFAKMARLLTEI